MLTEVIRGMDEHSENFNKKAGNIKKDQLEPQNTIREMKRTAEWADSGLNDSEEGSTVAQPMCHNSWAGAGEPRSHYCVRMLRPRTPPHPRPRTVRPETPPQREASAPQP